jgi:endonuclease I
MFGRLLLLHAARAVARRAGRCGRFIGALALATGALFGAAGLAAQEPDYRPPATYYTAAAGLTGAELKSALNERIRGHAVQSYANVAAAIPTLDAVPDQPGFIYLIYAQTPIHYGGSWDREHVWPQSYGTGTHSSRPGYTGVPAYSDFHHLFPCNPSTNNSRSNYAFDWLPNGVPAAGSPESKVDGSRQRFEPWDGDKGRIARAMFYMDVRYDGRDAQTGDLNLADVTSLNTLTMGYLTPLLQWHRMYPPDTREQRRNHLIYNGFQQGSSFLFQGNRNPFIDYPDLVDAVYTSTLYQTWGSWRVHHFSFAEIDDPDISGPFADAVGDGLPNVFAFSQNLDPQAPADPLPYVTRSGAGRVGNFHFRRLKDASLAGVEYIPEYSETPLTESSWTVWPANLQNPTVSTSGLTQTVRIADFSLPAAQRTRHFRLRIRHAHPVAAPQEYVFDPVSTLATTSSIFRYFAADNEGRRTIDWFGTLADAAYPWVAHQQHGLLHIEATDEESIWIHDADLGWLHTGRTIHPWFYAPASDTWYWFVDRTGRPERWFYNLRTEGFAKH